MTRARRSFGREYKLEAVRMVLEGGRPVSHVARELGVRTDLLRQWKQALEQEGAVARPPPKNHEEIRRLQREVAVLRQERDFPKKATVDSIGRRNTSQKGRAMSTKRRRDSDRSARGRLPSLGWPSVPRRDEQRLFWVAIAARRPSEEAASAVGEAQDWAS